jgi:hypothetical protein
MVLGPLASSFKLQVPSYQGPKHILGAIPDAGTFSPKLTTRSSMLLYGSSEARAYIYCTHLVFILLSERV